MNLDGKQAQQLSAALQDAFDPQSLRRMLYFSPLKKNLATISSGTNLADMVFDLIITAEQEGWTEDLVRAAYDSNPGNPKLRAFAISVGVGGQPHPSGINSAPTPADPDPNGRQTLAKVLQEKRRRLGVLELTAARYGIDTPPHIAIEIEDLKREIATLEQQLR